MAEVKVQLKTIAPTRILSEEEALKRYDMEPPFQSYKDYPEPSRTLFLSWLRLKEVYQQENQTPLIVKTPLGDGLVWRWWKDQIGILLFLDDGYYDQKITFIHDAQEIQKVQVDFTRIVTNPPSW